MAARKGAEANTKLKPPSRLLSAAIDFGTTFSGYAFSLKSNSKQIFCPQWKGANFQSLKTPTCLLLTPQEKFHSFGYSAEEKYSDLSNNGEEGEEGKWFYFKHFKMKLHSQEHPLKRKSKLMDEGGKKMSALTVFSMSIKYLKDQLLVEVNNQGYQIKDEEITWVLTVPAIWDEEAKQFMRVAAEEAKIPGEQLIIALEPEAASIFVKEINVKRDEKEEKTLVLSPYDPGTKFMVVDLGGGTVDITVREVMEDRTLKELYMACGNAYGGNTVNDKMYKFLKELVGEEIMEEFIRTQKAAAYDLEKEIESRKRVQDSDASAKKIVINLPGPLIELYEKKTGKAFSNSRFEETDFKKTVSVKTGKLKVDYTVFPDFFEEAGKGIQSVMRTILSQDFASGLKDVILVGGFADCLVIRHSIEKIFPELTFIIPSDAGLAVVKGAVLYGHNPNVVSSRVSKYTIGTEVHRYFLDTDDKKRRTMVDGTPYCKDVFNKLVEIGQTVMTWETVETEVFPLKADMTHMTVKVYKSTQKDPKYIDDNGCTYLGKMVVEMPDTTKGLERCVKVSLKFGETELKLTGKDDSTDEPVTVSLDMLS